MGTITVYLLRDTVKDHGDALSKSPPGLEIESGPSKYGRLYVVQAPSRAPKWAPLFEPFVDKSKLGKVRSVAAVFFVEVDGRMFALTFGHGRFLLKPEAIEERFGLLVTLNSVSADALRSVDKRAFVEDQNSRVQTGQASAALDFGVDIERDLIRGIVGAPDKSYGIGTRLAGADALTVAANIEVPKLKALLRKFLKAYGSTDYKLRFPWVDQVRQLNAKSPIVSDLNDRLEKLLIDAWSKNGQVTGCWLSVPDIVNWAKVRGFKYTRSPKEGVSSDLHLPGLVQAFPKETPTIDFLRMHHAMAVDENEDPLHKWPVYKCIQFETEINGKYFVLSAGNWFEIDKNFTSSVDAYVAKIPTYSGTLPTYKHANEDEYNKAAEAGSGGGLALMDKKMLKVGGIHDKVEFCDLYGDKTLIHVKHYGSSSVLGHLFNQGLVSGELLKSNAEYVDLANAQLPASHKLPLTSKTPRDLAEFRVVFAVISQSSKPGLHLPFFAKVVLKNTTVRLLEWGYKAVEIRKIDCDPVVLKKVLKPGKPPKAGGKSLKFGKK